MTAVLDHNFVKFIGGVNEKYYLISPAVPLSASAQQHVPTAAQCRIDRAAWFGDAVVVEYTAGKSESNVGSIRSLSVLEIKDRAQEMMACEGAYQDASYSAAWNFYFRVFGERYVQFVKRHGLTDQMLKEDAEGKR